MEKHVPFSLELGDLNRLLLFAHSFFFFFPESNVIVRQSQIQPIKISESA